MSIRLVTDSNGVTWLCFDEPKSAPKPKPKPKLTRKPAFEFELKIRVCSLEYGSGQDCWYYNLDDDGADRFIEEYQEALANEDYAYVDCEIVAHKRNDPNYIEWFELTEELPRKRATKRVNRVYQRMQTLGLPLLQEPPQQD